MSTPFSSERTARVRRNPWIMALAATPIAAAVVDLAGAAALGMPQLLVVFPHLLIFGALAVFFAWKKNAYAREVPGKIEAGEHGVTFGGELLVARKDLKSGVVLPRATGGLIVRLKRRGAGLPEEIRVETRGAGRGLLRALGFDASQSVAKFSLPSVLVTDPGWRKRIVGGVFGAFALAAVVAAVSARFVANVGPVFPLLLIPVVLALVVLSSIPSKLLVGADGLHLSWFRRARFLPYGEIARIDVFEDAGLGKNTMVGLAVGLKSGEVVRIGIQQKRAANHDEVNIIHERIAEAIETWRSGGGVEHAALVRRGGRDAAAWVRALRGIGAFANADARTAPVLPERLWRIVEDPAAPADARAGAAVALGLEADDEARLRLRAVASATAAPKLRIAIESAADNGPDEALAAALAELEAEETQARKRA